MLLATGFAAGAAFLENSKEFLSGIRTPRSSGTWSILTGSVKHRRRGKSTMTAPLRLAIWFTPQRMIAQTIIDNRQGYLLTQPFKAGASPTVIPLNAASKKKDSLIAHFGIHPGDLTMSFIYWKLLKELARDTIMMSECRVFLLESPDKKEQVKVWINVRYRFPLKCEWYKTPVTSKSKFYRAMEVSSFSEVDKIWVVTGIDLYGPGWRTKIEFPDKKAGLLKKGRPKDLFKTLKK
jgi:hypothetical protein